MWRDSVLRAWCAVRRAKHHAHRTPHVALILAVLCLHPAAQQVPTFRSAANEVPLYVTVVGTDGQSVPNLTAADFEILSDGPREITVFSSAPQPITATVMFDMSNSGSDQIQQLQSAGAAFVRALTPKDRIRIGTFGREIAISPRLTGDQPYLLRVLDEELWPGGPTPLWAAIDEAMSSLSGEPGRRVVVIFTDGADLVTPLGQRNRPDVEARAVREGFILYSIMYRGWIFDYGVRALANRTGGGHFELNLNSDLDATFTRVVSELHQQYLLGFVPATLDGKTHGIEIRMKHLDMTAKTRTSYVAEAK